MPLHLVHMYLADWFEDETPAKLQEKKGFRRCKGSSQETLQTPLKRAKGDAAAPSACPARLCPRSSPFNRRIAEQAQSSGKAACALTKHAGTHKDKTCDICNFVINRSRRLAVVFKNEVGKQVRQGEGARVTNSICNLSFAKQRFDSTAKPLGRCVLNLDALISEATLLRGQLGNEAQRKGAADFLDLLTDEVFILMGMMADASDECLLLTRFFDKEQFQIEHMAAHVAEFRVRLRTLFTHRQCLRSGYTRVALDALRTPKLIRRSDGTLYTLGGRPVPDDLLTTCLGRLAAWCRVAEEVCKTEFPDYEVLGAFSAFALIPNATKTTLQLPTTANTTLKSNLDRLAACFNVDAGDLADQFMDHAHLAQKEFDKAPDGEDATARAWRRATAASQGSPRRRDRFPAEALMHVLRRYMISPGSTAGIEQTFSKFKRFLGEQWNGSAEAEERRLILALAGAEARTPRDKFDLFASARLVWMRCFGMPHASGHDRRPTVSSRKRGRTEAKGAATAWLRDRRQRVGALAEQVQRASTDAAVERAADAAWTEKHTHEVGFQKATQREHCAAAVQEGAASVSCHGPDGAAELAAYTLREKRRQKDLALKHKRLLHGTQPPEPVEMAGRYVFVDPSARETVEKSATAWASARAARGLRLAADRACATVFVVMDPADAGDRNSAVAALTGGCLCSPGFFLHPPGVMIQLRRMLSLPRLIFFSDRCYAHHQMMIDMCRRVSARTRGGGASSRVRWTWFAESEGAAKRNNFEAKAAARRASGHIAECVTLLTRQELTAAEYRTMPGKTTLTRFLEKLRKVNARTSCTGVCGK